jgi:hypothetical protein
MGRRPRPLFGGEHRLRREAENDFSNLATGRHCPWHAGHNIVLPP